MKKIITTKSLGAALAALLAGSLACTTVFAYSGDYDYLFTYDADSVTASTDANGAISTADYSIEGTVITITGVGTYVVTGSGENGSISVKKGSDGVTLIFEDLTLVSADESTVEIGKDSTVDIVIEGDSSLTNTNEDGAVIKIKSGASVTITGDGTLDVDASEGKNGIKGASEATLTIGEDASDDFTLTVSAANNGIASDGSVVVNGGTVNITSDGDGLKSSPDEGDTASDGTITVNNGSITITSGEDGVQADGGFTMNDGTLNIVSGGGASNAANLDEDTSAKGIKSDSYIVIAGGDITIDSADDGIHLNGTEGSEAIDITNGTITIKSGDDGIHSDYALNIGTEGSTDGPTINIEQSYEGLEGATVNLNSGSGTINASDDGVNAANSDLTSYAFEINIDGGTWYINANGDGIDSNGDINVSGGNTTIFGAADNGNAAIDVGDNNNKFTVTGGSITGIGMSGMAVIPSSGTYLQFGTSGMGGGFGAPGAAGQQGGSGISVSAGQTIVIKDSDGNVVYSTTATKSANNIVFASDTLDSGKTYTLYINGTSAAQTTAAEGNGTTGSGMPAMPGDMGGGTGTMPGMPGDMSGGTGTMPGMPGDMSGGTGTMPGMPGDMSGGTGTMPGMPGDMGGGTGTMPGMPGDMSGGTGTMPGMPGDTSGGTGTMPGMPGDMSGGTGTMPEMPGDMGGVQQTALPELPDSTPSMTSTDVYEEAPVQASVSGSGTFYSSYIPAPAAAEDDDTAGLSREAARAFKAVESFLEKNEGKASFGQIESIFDKADFDYHGDKFVAVKKNLVVWYGWSDEAVDIINRLIVSGKVKVVPDKNARYEDIDEELSDLPTAKEMKDYNELHWLPASIELC